MKTLVLGSFGAWDVGAWAFGAWESFGAMSGLPELVNYQAPNPPIEFPKQKIHRADLPHHNDFFNYGFSFFSA